VVETDKGELPADKVSWEDLKSEAVLDRFDEYLTATKYTPDSRRIARVGQRIAKYHDPQEAVVEAANWVHTELDYVPGTTGVHSSGLDAHREGKGVLPGLRPSDVDSVAQHGDSRPDTCPVTCIPRARQRSATRSMARAMPGCRRGRVGGGTSTPPTTKEINEQYISVGVGRDYSDVTHR